LHLLGHDVRERVQPLADLWESKLEGERGFYAFNDIHAMAAFSATGREKSMQRLLGDMEHAARERGINATMTREVGLPVAAAIAAFGRGDYARAVSELEPMRDVAHRFGGSHAQRDMITLLLIEAALRAGQHRLAQHYIAERNVQRPSSALGWRLHARAVA
jgi:hypothetical protein